MDGGPSQPQIYSVTDEHYKTARAKITDEGQLARVDKSWVTVLSLISDLSREISMSKAARVERIEMYRDRLNRAYKDADAQMILHLLQTEIFERVTELFEKYGPRGTYKMTLQAFLLHIENMLTELVLTNNKVDVSHVNMDDPMTMPIPVVFPASEFENRTVAQQELLRTILWRLDEILRFEEALFAFAQKLPCNQVQLRREVAEKYRVKWVIYNAVCFHSGIKNAVTRKMFELIMKHVTKIQCFVEAYQDLDTEFYESAWKPELRKAVASHILCGWLAASKVYGSQTMIEWATARGNDGKSNLERKLDLIAHTPFPLAIEAVYKKSHDLFEADGFPCWNDDVAAVFAQYHIPKEKKEE